MALVTHDCLHCGQSFTRQVYGYKLMPGARPPMFCSSSCSAKARWSGHVATQRRMIAVKGHPLATRDDNRIFLYRYNLYEALGPGPHPCNWCGDTVEWIRGSTRIGALVVDHLDGDHKNNEVSNLVPSCQPCNVLRGRVLAWEERTGLDITRMKDPS
jgi:hypothetical protein